MGTKIVDKKTIPKKVSKEPGAKRRTIIIP
jgi:hypothetical protein